MIPPSDVARRLRDLPEGTVRGRARGRAYVASKTVLNGGRSIKLVAEQLGGPDYISLNFYQLGTGPRLFPCEMPADKVISFLRTFTPDQNPGEVSS